MKEINVAGLSAQPEKVECSVQVLGDPGVNDPSASENIGELERLAAVSSNGQWMALVRKRRLSQDEFYTILRADEGAEEMVVPYKNEWRHTRARDIANDGTFLFEAELERSFTDYGFSRRPLVFKPGNNKPIVLPPEYHKRLWGTGFLEDDRPRSHTPYCYAPDDTVFGWSHVGYQERTEWHRYDLLHCIWRKQATDEWQIEYLPGYLNNKWLWPGYAGTFIWADDRPERSGAIHFGLFDGLSITTFSVTLEGRDPKTVSVASDGTFLGSFGVVDGRNSVDREEDKVPSSYYSYVIRPQDQAIHVFNELPEHNPWLRELSANGRFVIGSHPKVGFCLLKEADDNYRYTVLQAIGWRIEDVVRVTDDGKVFGVATCTERGHDCFRLTLPVALTPQW